MSYLLRETLYGMLTDSYFGVRVGLDGSMAQAYGKKKVMDSKSNG